MTQSGLHYVAIEPEDPLIGAALLSRMIRAYTSSSAKEKGVIHEQQE
jgi:hypothetical protein